MAVIAAILVVLGLAWFNGWHERRMAKQIRDHLDKVMGKDT